MGPCAPACCCGIRPCAFSRDGSPRGTPRDAERVSASRSSRGARRGGGQCRPSAARRGAADGRSSSARSPPRGSRSPPRGARRAAAVIRQQSRGRARAPSRAAAPTGGSRWVGPCRPCAARLDRLSASQPPWPSSRTELSARDGGAVVVVTRVGWSRPRPTRVAVAARRLVAAGDDRHATGEEPGDAASAIRSARLAATFRSSTGSGSCSGSVVGPRFAPP